MSTSFSGRQGVAAQCFTLREEMKADWEGTLRAVAKAGFRAVQISAMGHVPTDPLARVLGELKLKVIGEHISIDALTDDPVSVALRARALGAGWVFLPWIHDKLRQPEVYKLIAVLLNSLAYRFRDFGLKVGYHHHDFEFQSIGDTHGLAIITRQTGPDVQIELDTHWAQRGGYEPAAYMRQHLVGRLEVLHVKDLGGSPEHKTLEIGQGTLNWPDIFAAADVCGTQWMVIEQDHTYGRSPLDSLAMSLAFMRRHGFAS